MQTDQQQQLQQWQWQQQQQYWPYTTPSNPKPLKARTDAKLAKVRALVDSQSSNNNELKKMLGILIILLIVVFFTVFINIVISLMKPNCKCLTAMGPMSMPMPMAGPPSQFWSVPPAL